MEQEEKKILDLIAQGIFDKKGFNILALDVQGICTMTDFFVIAEGSVDRHVKSIAKYLVDLLGPHLGSPLHFTGKTYCDWVILDYGYIVIHLFIPELREKYALEKLWHQGKIIDVTIDVHSNEAEAKAEQTQLLPSNYDRFYG